MERTHIPKLERDQIGVWDKMGWYLSKHLLFPSKDVVIFQCKYGHGAQVPAEATVNRDGTVDPIMQCHCLKFKQLVILDNWPDWFYKLAGKEEVVKQYSPGDNLNK